MAIPTGANGARRAYPEETWESVKPRIVHYYINEGCTLDRTMEALAREGFHATEKMYKTRIKKWGLKKYLKDEDAGQILQAAELDGGRHRAHTIGGKTVTAEDARRHLKRKKVKTWNSGVSSQPELLTPVMYADSDMITSPIDDGNMGADSLFPDSGWFPSNGIAEAQHQYQQQQQQQSSSSDEDVEMEDDEWTQATSTPELAVAPMGNFVVNPNLLRNPNLAFATQSFLFGMKDFCDRIVRAIPGENGTTLAPRRFNKLWDYYCTQATHQQRRQSSQAVIISNHAQRTFNNMLSRGDPWLLISLCLLLNDNMSNPERSRESTDFLLKMASWAQRTSNGGHIAQLILFLGQTEDAGPLLLEATLRMLCDRLRETIGPHHGVSLELSRLHSRIMTDVGMHSTAETLLARDLAEVESRYGSDSLQNLLRMSALARCKMMAKKYKTAVRHYEEILAHPKIEEPYIADVKYGALYLLAKCNAQLGNIDLAIEQTREALAFSLVEQGPDHYWTDNAKVLIAELERQRHTSYPTIEYIE